jgi:membrane protease YdiL (CAAX protease family)
MPNAYQEPQGTAPSHSTVTASLNPIFFGRDGLRAGWRLLIFAAMLTGIGVVVQLILMWIPLVRESSRHMPARMLVSEAALAVTILVATRVMSAIEKRPLSRYGYSGCGAARYFAGGAVWGLAVLTAVVLVMRLLGDFRFGSLAVIPENAVFYSFAWALGFLVVAFSEEWLFRGYPLYTLSAGLGFWPAALILSLVFGAIHLRNPGEEWIGGLAAALIGLFFCFTIRRTGSLWFAAGLHAGWDWAQSFVYSVPDSGVVIPGHLLNSSLSGSKWVTGGTVGPEGSVLTFGVMAVMFLVFNRWYKEARYPVLETPSLTAPPVTVLNPELTDSGL